MFELKISGQAIALLVVALVMVVVLVVNLRIMWISSRRQKKLMERISGEPWGNFGEWSSQTVCDIEASYDKGLPLPKNCPQMPRVLLPKGEVDEEEPTLDIELT
jgi:hypothetical protein